MNPRALFGQGTEKSGEWGRGMVNQGDRELNPARGEKKKKEKRSNHNAHQKVSEGFGKLEADDYAPWRRKNRG